MNIYGGNAAMSQPQYDSSIAAPSTQLARRPTNRQLVQTTQRSTYDNSGDLWGQFGDDPILDPQNANGMMENDNVELLEERAAVAKRDAQSKRKQIPPFVQKLSR
jgi:heat shock transcription factor